MQEISPNVFIDHNAVGLVTGVIRSDEGSVLLDPPMRQDEIKSWRGATARLVTGEVKYLVLLDTNYDRVLSARGSECVVVAHVNNGMPSKTRQQSAKTQEEAQAHSEGHEPTPGASRFAPPEVAFQDAMSLHIGDIEIRLEHHSGSNHAGVWAILPRQKVIFVGDTVLAGQAPFLAYSDPAAWVEDLKLLSSRAYRGYQIVSSRNGLVTQEHARAMGKLVGFVQRTFEGLAEKEGSLENYLAVIPRIMKRIEMPQAQEDLSFNRLRWGITTYYEQLNR